MPSQQPEPLPVPSEPQIVPGKSCSSALVLSLCSGRGSKFNAIIRRGGMVAWTKRRRGWLTCFFNLMTLNRSKSVRFFLRSCCSLFLAHDDSAHFESISFFSHSFLTGPVPAAFGRLGITHGVRETALVATACRGTTASSFVEGPSTRIWEFCERVLLS